MDDERVMKRRIGALVLIMLGVLFTLVFLFADQNFQWREKGSMLRLKFSNAPGVVPGTPVSRSGIRIGRVTNVTLQEDGMVLVTSSLDPGKLVFQGDSAMVVKPIMGDSEICISSRVAPGETPSPLTQNDVLTGDPYLDPMAFLSSIQGQVAGTLHSIEKTSDEMRGVFSNVNEIVGKNKDTIEGMITQAKTTTEVLQRIMVVADSFLADSEELRTNVREAVAQAPKLIAESRTAVQTLSNRMVQTLQSVDQTLATVNATVGGMDGHLDGLAREAEVAISHVNTSLDSADRLLSGLDEVTQKINKGQGTIGALVNERTLHDQITDTIANVELMTARLEPILNDMRILSDRLARHPEQLGAAGLINPSTGTKY